MLTARSASLSALCIHYTALTLTIHASRVNTEVDARYKASSCVALAETGKLIISILLAWREVHANQQADDGLLLQDYCTPTFAEHLEEKPLFGLGIVEDDGFEEYTSEKPALSRSTRRKTASQDYGRPAHSRSTSLQLAPSSPVLSLHSAQSVTANGLFMYQQEDMSSHHTLNISSDSSTASSSPFVCEQADCSLQQLFNQVFGPKFHQLALPAALFALQGNLQYLAVSNLSVPTFQVISQLKILTTAICSVILLQRHLTSQQWVSLLVLALGAAIVQLQSLRETLPLDPLFNDLALNNSTLTPASATPAPTMNAFIGFTAVGMMCLSSGFASIYFEKILKSIPSPVLPYHSPTSQMQESCSRPPGLTPIVVMPETLPVGLWIRNVQLSMFGLIMAVGLSVVESNSGMWATWGNGDEVVLQSFRSWSELKSGFLEGFTAVTWFVIFLQIIGGLLAALVMKYADNIQKNFATSFSIVLSFVASIIFFDFVLTLQTCMGSLLVIGSSFIFNSKDQDLRRLIGLSPR